MSGCGVGHGRVSVQSLLGLPEDFAEDGYVTVVMLCSSTRAQLQKLDRECRLGTGSRASGEAGVDAPTSGGVGVLLGPAVSRDAHVMWSAHESVASALECTCAAPGPTGQGFSAIFAMRFPQDVANTWSDLLQADEAMVTAMKRGGKFQRFLRTAPRVTMVFCGQTMREWCELLPTTAPPQTRGRTSDHCGVWLNPDESDPMAAAVLWIVGRVNPDQLHSINLAVAALASFKALTEKYLGADSSLGASAAVERPEYEPVVGVMEFTNFLMHSIGELYDPFSGKTGYGTPLMRLVVPHLLPPSRIREAMDNLVAVASVQMQVLSIEAAEAERRRAREIAAREARSRRAVDLATLAAATFIAPTLLLTLYSVSLEPQPRPSFDNMVATVLVTVVGTVGVVFAALRRLRQEDGEGRSRHRDVLGSSLDSSIIVVLTAIGAGLLCWGLAEWRSVAAGNPVVLASILAGTVLLGSMAAASGGLALTAVIAAGVAGVGLALNFWQVGAFVGVVAIAVGGSASAMTFLGSRRRGRKEQTSAGQDAATDAGLVRAQAFD